jgi:hypothetical protein
MIFRSSCVGRCERESERFPFLNLWLDLNIRTKAIVSIKTLHLGGWRVLLGGDLVGRGTCFLGAGGVF